MESHSIQRRRWVIRCRVGHDWWRPLAGRVGGGLSKKTSSVNHFFFQFLSVERSNRCGSATAAVWLHLQRAASLVARRLEVNICRRLARRPAAALEERVGCTLVLLRRAARQRVGERLPAAAVLRCGRRLAVLTIAHRAAREDRGSGKRGRSERGAVGSGPLGRAGDRQCEHMCTGAQGSARQQTANFLAKQRHGQQGSIPC